MRRVDAANARARAAFEAAAARAGLHLVTLRFRTWPAVGETFKLPNRSTVTVGGSSVLFLGIKTPGDVGCGRIERPTFGSAAGRVYELEPRPRVRPVPVVVCGAAPGGCRPGCGLGPGTGHVAIGFDLPPGETYGGRTTIDYDEDRLVPQYEQPAPQIPPGGCPPAP